MKGCEMIRCGFYKDGKCTDPVEYVDRETGAQVCRHRPEAIPKADIADMSMREAARDMYEVLKEIVKEFAAEFPWPLADRARRALARAEGRDNG